MQRREVYIIAGPNGSGKTAFARQFIKEMHLPFINADEIAMDLSPGRLDKVRIQAGRMFFEKIEKHIAVGKSFAIETTLSGKYLVRFIRKMRKNGYRIELIYILVESVEEAMHRIDIRVRKGGHSVPVEDVERRFMRSKTNFWNVYRNLVDCWQIFLNGKDEFLQTAFGDRNNVQIIDEGSFSLFKEGIE